MIAKKKATKAVRVDATSSQPAIDKEIVIHTAKVLLILLPSIRIADIIAVLHATKSLRKVPAKRTITKWLGEGGVVLSNIRPSKEEVSWIVKVLSPLHNVLSNEDNSFS